MPSLLPSLPLLQPDCVGLEEAEGPWLLLLDVASLIFLANATYVGVLWAQHALRRHSSDYYQGQAGDYYHGGAVGFSGAVFGLKARKGGMVGTRVCK